jgi:hypothetical protein
VAEVVQATDGSIGYLDLATAHQYGFAIKPNPNALSEPNKDQWYYWVPLQTINPNLVGKGGSEGVGTSYVEPSRSPKLNLSTSSEPGANCEMADYRGYPTTGADPTLGEWSQAIATGSLDQVTYPACGLTYDFAWDDDATAYGGSEAEEKQARTVKDYLTAVTSTAGQTEILSENYGSLSPALQQIARNGVAAIGWCKAGGCGGEEPGGSPGGGGTQPGGGGGGVGGNTIVPPPIITPSNVFTVASSKVKGKEIVLALVLPGAGKLQIKATAGGITVSSVSASVAGGQGAVSLPISRAAQTKLAKTKNGRLKVTITITFTPTGGAAATQTKTLTLTKASKRKGKAKGKKGKHTGHTKR